MELSLPPKSASWLIIIFLLVKKLGMKIGNILLYSNSLLFDTNVFLQDIFFHGGLSTCQLGSVQKPVSFLGTACCKRVSQIMKYGNPSEFWVTLPPNESSTRADQSHSVFCVVGDTALWLITIVGYHWSNGPKLIKKSIETTAGSFFNPLKNKNHLE